MNGIIKLLISGMMGAGKSTAVAAISDVPPVSSEAPIFAGQIRNGKTTTTVGFDYGHLRLADGRRVHVFGTPGQRHYDFMCRILAQGAIGLVILINHGAEGSLDELEYFVTLFERLIQETGAVVGVTHTDEAPEKPFHIYYDALAERGVSMPVVPVDVREPEQILTLLEALMTVLEYREAVC